MSATSHKGQPKYGTRVDQAIALANDILDGLNKGTKVSVALRRCERLGDLLTDDLIKVYAARTLQPKLTDQQRQQDFDYLTANRDARASGLYAFFADFQISGDPIGHQMKRKGKIEFSLLSRSVPEAETLVASARKTIKYSIDQRDFIDTIEQSEAVLERVRNRVYRYASRALSRLIFDEIPQHVFDATRVRVDDALAKNCPSALEKFAVAYQELAGSSAENWTNACTGVRRILMDFADAVFPPRSEPLDGRKVGPEEYVNRLWAYANQKIKSETDRALTVAELHDLGTRIDAIYALSNKGIHAAVTKDEADRIIIRTYLLIADLL